MSQYGVSIFSVAKYGVLIFSVAKCGISIYSMAKYGFSIYSMAKYGVLIFSVTKCDVLIYSVAKCGVLIFSVAKYVGDQNFALQRHYLPKTIKFRIFARFSRKIVISWSISLEIEILRTFRAKLSFLDLNCKNFIIFMFLKCFYICISSPICFFLLSFVS